MTKATSRNTRKNTAKANPAIYQSSAQEIDTIRRNIRQRSSCQIQLTAAQLDHYLFGDGLFLLNPQGETVAFLSAIDDSDREVNVVDGSNELERLEKLAEARAKLHLLQMLVVRDGHLELNETAVRGMATLLDEAQRAKVV